MLSPLACGVQTGVGSVLNVLRPEPGSTIAIFGSGSVGLSALLGARLTPASQIIMVDTMPSRLALASQLGATHVIDPRADEPVAAIMDCTHGMGAGRTLEASGLPSVLRQAVTALAIDGICGVVGAAPFGTRVSLDMPAMLTRNPHIIGINQGDSVPQQFIPALVDLHLEERLPFDRLITTFPFAKIEEAATLASEGSVVKPVLLVSRV
jgi:aryl-alcohol dehydrogenase